jgi:nucleotide-binding universal stress UspA family protein
MFETIVWATDGSRQADSALPIVTELADVDGSSIVVLYLDQSLRGSYGSAAKVRVAEDDVREKLESQVEDLRAAGFDARLEIVRTFAHDTSASVAVEAARLGADLIVVDTHGFGSPSAVFLGAITTGLTHHATCPVLVAPAKGAVAAPPADSAYVFPWSWR